LNIDELVREISFRYPDHVSRIKELSEKPTIKNILLIRDLLLRLYKTEQDPKSAQKVKKVVEQVHSVLQKVMSGHYLQFLRKLNSTKQIKKDSALQELEKLSPFHWILEFNEVFSRGGFDIVLGNPPYVEFSEIAYPLSQFRTRHCGNIYAPFFERAINVAKTGGYFGYIVPISSVCTDRMKSLQELLIQSSMELKISNFDDRPDKIFKGLEHCRSSIIFGHKDSGSHRVLSTHYHRWHAEEREKLFKHMSFADVTEFVQPGIIPKIGSEIEKAILKKIHKNKPLSNLIVDDSKHFLIYHNAPQYWIRAMNFMPEFSNEKGASVSPHNKQISISEETNSLEEIIAALNSSLFYWFFILHSNCRDLTEREIKNFPFDVTNMESSLRGKLKNLCHQLMDDYKKHSRLKEAKYQRTGKVTYREFNPKESKAILDEIDNVLAQHYRFSDEESEYIKGFDNRFRMGEQPDKERANTLDLRRLLYSPVDAQKPKKLDQPDETWHNYLAVDVSAFLSTRRLAFLLKLLEEKELLPRRVVLADKIYSILSKYVKEGRLSEDDLLLFQEIAESWEGHERARYPDRNVKWTSDKEFLSSLKIFFQKWKPLPASEVIGYERPKNPIDAGELRRRLGLAGDIVYDELKTAERTRCCILCLSRGLARLLGKARHFLIEIPHAKKKVWMKKHDWVGGLLFFVVTGVSTTKISATDLENLLSEIAQHASPIVRNLFADVDIQNLARWVLQLLGPTIAAGFLGAVSVAIAFDSIRYPKIVFKP
jgi:hypothetical protein